MWTSCKYFRGNFLMHQGRFYGVNSV
jgi:hypothetical protein